MRSSARKIHLSPSVDLTSFASSTAGYSGADLQALIYNAHLDAIHEQLTAAEGAKGEEERKKGGEEEEVRYVEIGGREGGKVLSRAEQASVNKRVRGRLRLSFSFAAQRSGEKGVTDGICDIAARAHHGYDEGTTAEEQPSEEAGCGECFARFESARSSRLLSFLSPFPVC